MTREGREGGRASETRCSDDKEEEEEVHITLQLQVIGIALDPGTFLHASEIHYIFPPDYRPMEPRGLVSALLCATLADWQYGRILFMTSGAFGEEQRENMAGNA